MKLPLREQAWELYLRMVGSTHEAYSMNYLAIARQAFKAAEAFNDLADAADEVDE